MWCVVTHWTTHQWRHHCRDRRRSQSSCMQVHSHPGSGLYSAWRRPILGTLLASSFPPEQWFSPSLSPRGRGFTTGLFSPELSAPSVSRLGYGMPKGCFHAVPSQLSCRPHLTRVIPLLGARNVAIGLPVTSFRCPLRSRVCFSPRRFLQEEKWDERQPCQVFRKWANSRSYSPQTSVSPQLFGLPASSNHSMHE